MPLNICQAGELVLRQKARLLSREEILGREIQELIEQMRETMRNAPGVGLAAPQVGLPLQLAVIEDPAEFHKQLTQEQMQERGRKPVPFHVIINPRIVRSEGESQKFFEGCLSVAGLAAIVPRARSVVVECLNEKAEPVQILGDGWHARILQHEIDHLHGTLYVDRMDTRTLTTVENMNQFWKDLPIAEVLARLK